MGKILVASVFVLCFVLSVSVVLAAGGGGGSPVVVKKLEPKPFVPADVTPDEAANLKCSALKSINERVSCRIGLEGENEFNYLPEECRSLNGSSRENCKGFYSSVQSCWASVSDADSVACVRRQLNLGGDVSSDVSSCAGDGVCLKDVAERVHSLNKFRLYNLEWKAEYLVESEGVPISRELLVDLVVNLELKKQEYNSAVDIEGKIQALRGVRQIWKSFADKVRTQVAE